MHFVDIDPANWRLRLTVTDSQERFVSSTTALLARAYAYRKARSRAFWIYEENQPVGMGLYYDEPEIGCYNISQLLIDAHHQRQGYGKKATRMMLELLKNDGRYSTVRICYVDGNEAARNLYADHGFRELFRDEEEIVMELHLGTSQRIAGAESVI